MQSAYTCILWLLSCSGACRITPHGEWTAAECSDGLDNDGDQRIDCADPDCWAFSCQAADATPPDAGYDAGAAPHDAAAPDAMPHDAMRPPPPVEIEDAGPVSTDEDSAAAEPDCRSDSSLCKAGEVCMAGVCQLPSTAGDYMIQIVSAAVPARNPGGVCYDPDLFCPPTCVGCDPDPSVSILKNGVVMIGLPTTPKTDTETATWNEASYKVSLSNSDTLEFIAWDDDILVSSRIFSCSPDLEQLPSGTLRCSPTKGMTIAPSNGEVFEVVAHVMKLP